MNRLLTHRIVSIPAVHWILNCIVGLRLIFLNWNNRRKK